MRPILNLLMAAAGGMAGSFRARESRRSNLSHTGRSPSPRHRMIQAVTRVLTIDCHYPVRFVYPADAPRTHTATIVLARRKNPLRGLPCYDRTHARHVWVPRTITLARKVEDHTNP